VSSVDMKDSGLIVSVAKCV